jgi:hypothetical protein
MMKIAVHHREILSHTLNLPFSASSSMHATFDSHLISLCTKKMRSRALLAQLRAYLHAHGLDTGARGALAKTGVGDAILRGRADASTCWTTIESCVKTCTKPQPVGYDRQCGKDCADENPACRSGRRCSEELQLPP